MPYALILVGAHLTTAPRAVKEAAVLAAAGWDVVIGGAWFDPERAERDMAILAGAEFQFIPLVDARPTSIMGALRRGHAAMRRRRSLWAYHRDGTVAPDLLGMAVRRQLEYALTTRPDLAIAHSEGGLWVASQLLGTGIRLGVDFEDWFSEDLPPEARGDRPVQAMASLERQLLRRATYRIAASAAMAGALAMRYGVPAPRVVYNAFPRGPLPEPSRYADRRDRRALSLHWFSQTIGPGRGLEFLMATLPLLNGPVELHIRGEGRHGGARWIRGLIPRGWENAVHLHETVPNAELPLRIAEHDVGLALEIPHCLSRELTATNKLFQYLEAGLAVIATRTTGQDEVLRRCPGAGTLVAPGDSGELARAINAFLAAPEVLAKARRMAAAGSVELSWDRQAEVIVSAAAHAVRPEAERLTSEAAERCTS